MADGDHPRRCGENNTVPVYGRQPIGSPPQVRGKLCTDFFIGQFQRITPAGAGKTPSIRHLAGGGRDHPRRCGENRTDPKSAAERLGSPPQVRGKPPRRIFSFASARITPAGAGKTRATLNERFVNQDHPRRCGENGRNLTLEYHEVGSPPQVRGKPS